MRVHVYRFDQGVWQSGWWDEHGGWHGVQSHDTGEQAAAYADWLNDTTGSDARSCPDCGHRWSRLELERARERGLLVSHTEGAS